MALASRLPLSFFAAVYRRSDSVDQRRQVSRQRRAVLDRFDRGVDGAAGVVAEHHDQRRVQHLHGIFQARDNFVGREDCRQRGRRRRRRARCRNRIPEQCANRRSSRSPRTDFARGSRPRARIGNHSAGRRPRHSDDCPSSAARVRRRAKRRFPALAPPWHWRSVCAAATSRLAAAPATCKKPRRPRTLRPLAASKQYWHMSHLPHFAWPRRSGHAQSLTLQCLALH